MTTPTESGAGGGYVSDQTGPVKFVDEVETGLYRLAQALALDPAAPEEELERYTPEELGIPAEGIERAGALLYAASSLVHRAHWLLIGKPEAEAAHGDEVTVTLPKQSLRTAAKVLASIDGGECYKPRDMTHEVIHEAAHDLEAAASELES